MQVHKARLHDGRQVAVKVQYLGLEAAVAADMTTLSALSTLAAWLFPSSFELGWVLDDLKRNLDLELDFRLEAENATKLMQFFRGRNNITAPAVIPEVNCAALHELRCTASLTMLQSELAVPLNLCDCDNEESCHGCQKRPCKVSKCTDRHMTNCASVQRTICSVQLHVPVCFVPELAVLTCASMSVLDQTCSAGNCWGLYTSPSAPPTSPPLQGCALNVGLLTCSCRRSG